MQKYFQAFSLVLKATPERSTLSGSTKTRRWWSAGPSTAPFGAGTSDRNDTSPFRYVQLDIGSIQAGRRFEGCLAFHFFLICPLPLFSPLYEMETSSDYCDCWITVEGCPNLTKWSSLRWPWQMSSESPFISVCLEMLIFQTPTWRFIQV